MKIKQVKYDEKIGNLFEAEKINNDLLLKEKGELFNGKLELVYDDGSIQSENSQNDEFLINFSKIKNSKH